MLKKLIFCIVVYILLRFPAGLLEDWVMGEVLEQIEANWLSLFILWILPLLAAIGLVAIANWVWKLIKRYKTKTEGEYQVRSSSNITIKTFAPSIIIGKAGDLKYELNAANKKDRLLEAKVPIQSVRFLKPIDKVIRRGDSLPVIIECERNCWKRFRNKLLFVLKPQIIVKCFTENGVKWDEENIEGADISIEFYPK